MNDLPQLWPHQAYACAEVPRLLEAGERKICLTSPTGGGKSRIACELIEWGIERKWKVVLYTNRKLLINQLSGVLERHGIEFGIRAAGHEDNRQLDVQISSLPTEGSRVFKLDKWQIHGHEEKTLAIVDEAHLNKAAIAEKILKLHLEHGGAYVGITATPIGLKHLYDKLVIAGTPSQLRACKCLVHALHYGPDEPDMKNFKTSIKTGEYREGDIKKAIMTKHIFGSVVEHYRRYNPDGRPTILFAPGVKESIWFAEELCKRGINAAHIDGQGIWVDGQYYQTTDRSDLLAQCRDGSIQVLCNRFVLREGLDLPEVGHIIVATVMGSLQTWLQSIGRGLRYCNGKLYLTIQDHGGHWWRHGSVNADRDWTLDCTEQTLKEAREERFIEKKDKEPIRCPKCGMIRATGEICQQCGFQSTKRTRIVVQANGALREYEGDVFKAKKVEVKSNTTKLWEQMFWRAKNSRNRMTFKQAEGLFFYENHYWPPHDLPFMPLSKTDWSLPVASVSWDRLIPKDQGPKPEPKKDLFTQGDLQ